MSEKERSKQRVESFLNELEQGTASLTNEELARLERMIMERRGRAAAHVVVASVGTAQPSKPRSRCSEISFDVHGCMEGNTEGRMDPVSRQLKPPSVGTGFEAPGQQGLSNWEMEQTSTANGCSLVGMSSNSGKNIFSLEEFVIGTQTDSQTLTPSASSKNICKR